MAAKHYPYGRDLTSPLHLLAGYSTPSAYLMVQTLLSQGKNANCKNEDGVTPVHVAASRGNYETLKLLLSNGGDPFVIDNDGKTPSDLAADEDHTECQRLLNWWQEETKDTPIKPICIDASSPFVDRTPYTSAVINSPISQIYSSPRFFASPLKDSTNSPKYLRNNSPKFFKNNSPTLPSVFSDVQTANKSWRKIDFIDKEEAGQKQIGAISNDVDRMSLITNDESPTHRQKFVEFHECADCVQIQTPPSTSSAKLPTKESPKRNGFFELSCCTTSSSPTSSNEASPPVPSDDIVNVASPTNNDSTPSLLNRTLFNADVSFETTFSEELSKILRITSTPMPENEKNSTLAENNNETNKTNDDDAAAENTLKTILEQSLRRDRSEIENIDPRRLSICKKLTDAELRTELTRHGYEVGPITNGTRWLYVRRLALTSADDAKIGSVPKYSVELEKLLRGTLNLTDVVADDKEMSNFFELPEKHWREGRLKMSFCYLLLDPTTFPSSPDSKNMDEETLLRTFVKSIFYVGKGKKSRPLQHLTDAAKVMSSNRGGSIGPKIQKILHLWNSGDGIISLHIFQNVIPVEAYTREAAMIDAIGIHNLTNVKRGDYYGLPTNWSDFKRRRFGAYLLKTAASILKLEGRRPLKLNDVVAAMD